MVHEGNVYFEHCYGADFNVRRTDTEREACWNAWLAHYTRHQAAHRIDYAMRRVEAIQSGEPALSLPGMDARSAQGHQSFEAAGLVTLQGPRAGAEVSTVLDPSAPTAGALVNGCAEVCRADAASCGSQCPADAATCQRGCARDQAICEAGCY